MVVIDHSSGFFNYIFSAVYRGNNRDWNEILFCIQRARNNDTVFLFQ